MEQQNYTDKPTLAKWNELVSAAASVPKIVTGTYTGNGAETRTIDLGFTPKAVLVVRDNGAMSYYQSGYYGHFGGLVLRGVPASDLGVTFLAIVEGGFQVVNKTSNASIYLNMSGNVYVYLAIA